ncbi:MAG: hypothetical protein AAF513_19535 [Pseudomonadota bacterium]
MSYILDALKKTQAEQHNEGVALHLQRQEKRGLSRWIIIVFGGLLVANLAVMAWFVVRPDTTPPVAVTTPPKATSSLAPTIKVDNRALDAQTERTVETSPTNSAPREAAAASPPQSPPPQEQAIAPTQTSPAPAPTPAPLPRFALSDLAAYEQTLYNSFRYSSHMFSPDDPTAGAIFIDGQMLRIGASFKGLVVADITEFTVIFEENRRGKKREVEVNLADQWDRP